jgi:hypothetical protein
MINRGPPTPESHAFIPSCKQVAFPSLLMNGTNEPIGSPVVSSGAPLDSISDGSENSLVTEPWDDSPHKTIMFHAKNANVGSGCRLQADAGAIGHCLRLCLLVVCYFAVWFYSTQNWQIQLLSNAAESAHIVACQSPELTEYSGIVLVV